MASGVTTTFTVLCDHCDSVFAVVFCQSDGCFLCLRCDAEVHANKVANRHSRVPVTACPSWAYNEARAKGRVREQQQQPPSQQHQEKNAQQQTWKGNAGPPEQQHHLQPEHELQDVRYNQVHQQQQPQQQQLMLSTHHPQQHASPSLQQAQPTQQQQPGLAPRLCVSSFPSPDNQDHDAGATHAPHTLPAGMLPWQTKNDRERFQISSRIANATVQPQLQQQAPAVAAAGFKSGPWPGCSLNDAVAAAPNLPAAQDPLAHSSRSPTGSIWKHVPARPSLATAGPTSLLLSHFHDPSGLAPSMHPAAAHTAPNLVKRISLSRSTMPDLVYPNNPSNLSPLSLPSTNPFLQPLGSSLASAPATLTFDNFHQPHALQEKLSCGASTSASFSSQPSDLCPAFNVRMPAAARAAESFALPFDSELDLASLSDLPFEEDTEDLSNVRAIESCWTLTDTALKLDMGQQLHHQAGGSMMAPTGSVGSAPAASGLRPRSLLLTQPDPGLMSNSAWQHQHGTTLAGAAYSCGRVRSAEFDTELPRSLPAMHGEQGLHVWGISTSHSRLPTQSAMPPAQYFLQSHLDSPNSHPGDTVALGAVQGLASADFARAAGARPSLLRDQQQQTQERPSSRLQFPEDRLTLRPSSWNHSPLNNNLVPGTALESYQAPGSTAGFALLTGSRIASISSPWEEAHPLIEESWAMRNRSWGNTAASLDLHDSSLARGSPHGPFCHLPTVHPALAIRPQVQSGGRCMLSAASSPALLALEHQHLASQSTSVEPLSPLGGMPGQPTSADDWAHNALLSCSNSNSSSQLLSGRGPVSIEEPWRQLQLQRTKHKRLQRPRHHSETKLQVDCRKVLSESRSRITARVVALEDGEGLEEKGGGAADADGDLGKDSETGMDMMEGTEGP